MADYLADFLGPLTPVAEEMGTWPTDTMRLACDPTDSVPPRRYGSSFRVVVANGDRVLVVQDPRRRQILPGRRLEPNETPGNAVRREVLEEMGWRPAHFRPIGKLHFTRLGTMPVGWRPPVP